MLEEFASISLLTTDKTLDQQTEVEVKGWPGLQLGEGRYAEEEGIPDPAYRLLRRPCTRNNPALVMDIDWLHTVQNNRDDDNDD